MPTHFKGGGSKRLESVRPVHDLRRRVGSNGEFRHDPRAAIVVGAFLWKIYGVDLAAVQLVTGLAHVLLGVDSAMPCGFIVNELVSI